MRCIQEVIEAGQWEVEEVEEVVYCDDFLARNAAHYSPLGGFNDHYGANYISNNKPEKPHRDTDCLGSTVNNLSLLDIDIFRQDWF